MTYRLPNVVITNLHRRYTGVSATIKHTVPHQQQRCDVAIVDHGALDLPQTIHIRTLLRYGWQKPSSGSCRILHVRRDVEMLLGLALKYVLRQPWRLVFTADTPRRHGRFLRTLIHRMDAIIATSARAASFLDWHSIIIPHGVDTDHYRPTSKKPPPERYWVGAFGRIRPSKGSDLLVEALIQVLPHHPKWSAFFTGLCKDLVLFETLKQRIEAAGLSERILFLGDLSHQDILKQYQRCQLVAACSRSEGYGLTPLEGMAMGIPALTSHAGVWPEIIRPNVNGDRFETGNVSDLTTKLDQMLSKPEALKQMGEQAQTFVRRQL